MSDYLFVAVSGATIAADAQAELEAFIRRECAGLVPHNRLSHFRAIVSPHPKGALVEPIIPGGITANLLRAIVKWAATKAPRVSIRLEGHRGAKPLPELERRSGGIDEALAFKSHRRRPHHVEFLLRGCDQVLSGAPPERSPQKSVHTAHMDAQQAFVHFVGRVLTPGKARRFTTLAATAKGQRTILRGIDHQFGAAIRPSAIRTEGYEAFSDKPCFAFHAPLGFGVEFGTVREALDKLYEADGWLIVLADGSGGIHRPEGRWDAEKLLFA